MNAEIPAPLCPHGYVNWEILCPYCCSLKQWQSPPLPSFKTIAKVGPGEMREITRGAEWELKVEGVPAVLPRRRLTLRLSEREAEILVNYAYMPSTGTLVKYKLRKVIQEYFGDFMMNLIDATELPILILPWGDPIGSWMREA